MARDQVGCRFLQKKLEEQNPFTYQTIYEQVFDELGSLMVHPFGNYLCQKLFEVSEESFLVSILNLVSKDLEKISLDQHGTRATQKLIDIFSQYPRHLPALVACFRDSALTLIKDINGNHVIQRILHSLSAPWDQFVYDTACRHLVDIAKHRHGCCVLQRSIDAANSSQRAELVEKIIENSVELVQDAFGNYVVQYVLDLNEQEANSKLAYIFIGNMTELSTQKFSSNVIEKCLQLNKGKVQEDMINEIAKEKQVKLMIKDQYANYVVQRALAIAQHPLKALMLQAIQSALEDLKASVFGKRIFTKLVKNYPELLDYHC